MDGLDHRRLKPQKSGGKTLTSVFSNGPGDHLKFKHDVIFQVQSGGAHGAQWIAPLQVGKL
jgi:hypothetical protein